MDKAYEGVMQWIAQARAAGLLDAQITEQLKGQGWQGDQIQKILTPAPTPNVAPVIVPMQTPAESVRTEIQKAFDPSVKPKGKSWPMRHLVLLASVLGGLIVLGGVAFAAIRGYIPVPFLNKSNLQDQLVKAIDVLSGTKSGEIGLAISVKVEPQDGTAKRWPEPATGSVSPAQARAQDSQLASDAGQLRTGLALYYDTNNSYPAKITEVAEQKFISRLPEEVKDHPITYTLSEDKKNYTLRFTCVSDVTKYGEIDSKKGTATRCYSSDNGATFIDSLDSSTLFKYLPSDMQLEGKVVTFVGEQDVNGKKTPRGYVSLKGTYASGGTTIAVDGEVRMQDAKYYGIVRQFPSLFFIDLTSLKDKWVLIDPAAGDSANGMFPLDSVASLTPKNKDLNKAKNETVTFIRKALDTKAIVLTREGSENLNGRRLNKIKITLDATQIPAAVSAYKEDATKRNALVKEVGEALDELVKTENLDRLRVIAGQTTLTMWMENLNGTPHKLQFETIVVPPEKVEKLKDKQVRLSIALTFEHLGEQPKVDVPANPISLDEAERLISGITEEQQKFDKQRGVVDDLRSALTNYKRQNNAFPNSLDALLSKPKDNIKTTENGGLIVENVDNPSTNSDVPANYFSSYNPRTVIPKDVFTGKPFVYARKDAGYTLTYEMVLPKASDEDSPYNGSSYYTEMYIAGENTADEHVVSREVDATKDADYDGLTGAEELKYNTNSMRADTDADGSNDKIEIQAKTNPLDPMSRPKTAGKDLVIKQYTKPLAGSAGTIHFWVRSENWKASAYMHMVNYYDATGSERLLIRYANDGSQWLSFILYPAGSSFVGWTTSYELWKPNTWTHVATTWKVGEVPKTYINGVYLDTFITPTQQTQVMTQQMASALSTAGTLYLNGRKLSDGGNTEVEKFTVEDTVLSTQKLTEIAKNSPSN